MRFFAEQISVGVLPEKGALNLLSGQLNILINYDKEEHTNVSIIQSFCRHCGSDYAGLVPRKYRYAKHCRDGTTLDLEDSAQQGFLILEFRHNNNTNNSELKLI